MSDRIAELRRIGEQATEGPWEHNGCEVEYGLIREREVVFPNGFCHVVFRSDESRERQIADAKFIATARNQWPALMRMAEAVRDFMQDFDCGETETGWEEELRAVRKALAALDAADKERPPSPRAKDLASEPTR